MPKKMGVNSKAEAARERRSAAESERRERQAREKEDRYWREAEGTKSRAAKKREENADKRLEAATRRADNRRLAEQEQADLDRKVDRRHRVSAPAPKVTVVDLERRKEEERQRALRIAEEAKKRQSRTAEEEDYHRLVLVANTNRDESVIDARSVDEALAKISLAADNDSSLPRDRHPEKRLKATFKAFEEAELPKLKEDKPGLTLNQYKDMIWKMWKKSPDNPLNQVAE